MEVHSAGGSGPRLDGGEPGARLVGREAASSDVLLDWACLAAGVTTASPCIRSGAIARNP